MLHQIKKSMYTFLGKRLARRHGERVPDEPSPIEIPSRWVEPHKRARISLGLYEKDESALVASHLDPDLDTVELGSGVGVISSRVCRKLNPQSRFVGLEGNPELVEVAKRNIARFDSCTERTIEHAVVVGEYAEGGTRTFHITPGNFHASSIEGGQPGAIEVVAPALSLSELLRRHQFDSYQLVSDVEGAELEILLQDPEALTNCTQMIIELHPCECEGKKFAIDDIAKMIVDQGFRPALQKGDVFVFQRQAA